jgi:hypothetical protein
LHGPKNGTIRPAVDKPRQTRAASRFDPRDHHAQANRMLPQTCNFLLIVFNDRLAVRPPGQISLVKPTPCPERLLCRAGDCLAVQPTSYRSWSNPEQLRRLRLRQSKER